MRTVECKKLGSVTSLTVGKVYPIISETDDRYSIANDKGVEMRYGKNLFNNPVEVPEAGAPARRGPGRPRNVARPEPAQVPAPAAAPIVVNQLEVITGADSDEGSVKFSILFRFLPDREFRYETGRIIETNGISASCGIQSLSGLDSLNAEITNIRNRFVDYISENRNNFILSNDIDTNSLFDEIAAAFIQDLVATYQGDEQEVKAGILILSTTASFINQQPCLRRALDNASVQSIPVHNPNSGNDIIMWNIAVEA